MVSKLEEFVATIITHVQAGHSAIPFTLYETTTGMPKSLSVPILFLTTAKVTKSIKTAKLIHTIQK